MITRSIIRIVLIAGTMIGTLIAGNPDRLGQAGAYELLINPFARSGGLHSLNTASVTGLEAIRLNVAGLSHCSGSEVIVSHSQWLQGSGTNVNFLGLAQSVGESGALGVELMSMSFGEIPITTTDLPEGGIGYYKPSFINVGLAYSVRFSESISAGVTVRVISEAISDVSASGMALDAGVQYTTGSKNQMKFGVALRNIGRPLSFSGDGLSIRAFIAESYQITVSQRSEKFELPSLLHIGLSYEFLTSMDNQRLTAVANFQSNAFSNDDYGVGFEYAIKEKFMFRLGYRTSRQTVYLTQEERTHAFTGLAGGFGMEFPMGENSFGLDYSYRATNPFKGVHALGVRITI
tara:strand:+ start:230 stop:1273 length:1044 start_codon:yes stop_codon:yes gene_type:complete